MASEYDIHWEVNNYELMHDLDHWINGVDAKLAKELNFIIETGYEDTQRIVHQPPRVTRTYVLTGSLKASGKWGTSTHGEARGEFVGGHDWEGYISYGGESKGFPHDPVEYAVFEADRGESHDFMAPTYEIDPMIERAIDEWFRG